MPDLEINTKWKKLWLIRKLLLLLLLIMISSYGLVVLYSASGQDAARLGRQFMALLVAFACMLIAAQFRVKTIKALAPLAYLVGVLYS